ncbi:hypothetical protein ABIB94_004798 [Bradyrhizobium sp. JR7.2]|jgi:hypothetical protein
MGSPRAGRRSLVSRRTPLGRVRRSSTCSARAAPTGFRVRSADNRQNSRGRSRRLSSYDTYETGWRRRLSVQGATRRPWAHALAERLSSETGLPVRVAHGYDRAGAVPEDNCLLRASSALLAMRGWAAPPRASMTVPAPKSQPTSPGPSFWILELIKWIGNRVFGFLLAILACWRAALACPRCAREASQENAKRGRSLGCSHLTCEQCGKTSDIAGWRLQGLSAGASEPLIR